MRESYSLFRIAGAGITVLVGLGLVVALFVGAAFGCNAYSRYQKRANANNNVKVTAIEIRNQDQKVKVEQQKAQIRYVRSVGVRRAQDEIAKTLTPMYVKFEMVDALRQIAQSGQNNSVIYIPTSNDGLAVTPTLRAGEGK